MKLLLPFLLLLCAVPGQATITLFGAASSPADNGSQAGSTVAVTPPASMLAGDLAVLIAQNRDAAQSNIRISEPGGQGWSFPQEFVDAGAGFGAVSTAVDGRFFWCRFNGTWSANPSITLTNGAVTPLTVVMVVFRPTTSSKFWVGDVGPNYGNFAAPITPFTVTRTGLTTVADSTVTLALWAVPASNTWGTRSGSGWSQTGLSTQYRNISGSGQSISIGYNIRSAAGAVADVSQNESAGTAGSTFIMSLAEVDLPTGGGTGSTGGIQTASFQEESAANTVAATFASAVGSGHAVVGMAHYEVARASYPVSITDNQGNSYTVLSRISNTQFLQDQLVFFRPNITNGPTTVTLTISDSEITHGIILREVDNINAFDKFGAIDQFATDAFSPQTISTIPALTLSHSNAYLFGSAHLPGHVETNPFFTVAAGWTKVSEIGGNPTGHPNAMIAERILGSPSSLQFTWTINLGRDASTIVAAFAPAAMNPPLDFSIGPAAGGPTSATVKAGQTATYLLQLSLVGGAAADQLTVAVSCTGAPSKAMCSGPASPVTVTQAGPAAVAISVSTTANELLIPSAPRSRLDSLRNRLPILWLFAMLSMILWMLLRRQAEARGARSLWSPKPAFTGLVLLFVVTIAAISGCNGGGSSRSVNNGTPVGTYTLTVTATSGNLSHTQPLTLTVQ